MKFYNTMTREKEEFAPLKGNTVRIYSCGPTVYNYAHIGNLRTYIFMDLLRRGLRYNGYKLRHVMNITDVGHLTDDGDDGEDKMAKASREQKKTPWEIAAYYTEVFFKDIDRLNITRPEVIAKATEHIQEMLDYVYGLDEKGFAYETSDGIYFDIGKLAEHGMKYGQLSNIDLEGQQAGARVEVNSEKHHPADFAIWKKAPKEHIMQWDSRWGMGYPGWHIECSAMGLKYLGEYFDIHTGGVDHIPIHHENEIAQACGLLGHPAAKSWMHGEFMLVDGGKMSKSLGNTYTVEQLVEKGYAPLDFRYFCLGAHYRQKLNFTFDGMDAAKKALANLRASCAKLAAADADGSAEDLAKLSAFKADFDEAVNDDLNIPKALGVVWTIVRTAPKCRQAWELVKACDAVLGLDLDKLPKAEEPAEEEQEHDPEIEAAIAARAAAKKAKNYAEADRIRNELAAKGITLIDTPKGVKWTRS